MLRLHAGVHAPVPEAGADFAFLDLVVTVIRVAGAQAHRFHAVERPAVFTAQVHAAAVQVHERRFLFAVLVLMAFFRAIQAGAVAGAALELVAVAGQAVEVAAVGVGDAQIAPVTDP